MALGKYKVPSELKDENKWLKFFTIPQLTIVGTAFIVALAVGAFLTKCGLFPFAVFFFLVVMLCALSLVMIKVPDEYYLLGARQPVGMVLLRLVIKKGKYHRVYVSYFNDTRRKDR